jgi:hypothetical protein
LAPNYLPLLAALKSSSSPAMKLDDVARQIINGILALRFRQIEFLQARKDVLGRFD